MSKNLSPSDKICILLTLILDEGINKYEESFKKLIQRLNEFYDTNKVDIINYFSKAIMYLPTKTTIYSNALYSYNKPDITNEILKKLIEELNKTKNSFIFIRTFIFIYGLIHFNIIPNQNLADFIQECISRKNVNLLNIIVYSIFLMYRKNKDYQFLGQYIKPIYDSNIIPQDDLVLKSLYEYSVNDNPQSDGNSFDGLFIKDIKLEESNDNNMSDNNDIINILNELLKINYDSILCPQLISRKFVDENKGNNFNDIYYELLILNNMEAFKDEPNKGTSTYLFSLPELYYNISKPEDNNGVNPYQFIVDNFTYASVDLVLFTIFSKSDLSYIINYILYVLKEKKAYFKIINQDSKEENIYTSFIVSLLSNENFIPYLSPFQLDNLIYYLYHLISNVPLAKKSILSCIQKFNNNTNNNDVNMALNDTTKYFINSFYEKISNLIRQETWPEEFYYPEKNDKPNTIDSITNLSYYKQLYTNINSKKSFKDFDKTIFENDNQNETLYTFIYCLLNSRNTSLSSIHDLIELYSSAIRELINNNNDNSVDSINDKQKIILKVIFDVYGQSPVHFIYIIDLLAFQNLLNHIIVINFIFTEKLFQNKDNGLTYSYYYLINNSIENCYTMLNKFDNDFQNLAKGFQKVEESKRKEIQLKMDFLSNEVAMLNKQKDTICDNVLEQFIKLYEISEGLGGAEYKGFIQKVIQDEIMLFQNKYKVSEEMVDKAKKLFK